MNEFDRFFMEISMAAENFMDAGVAGLFLCLAGLIILFGATFIGWYFDIAFLNDIFLPLPDYASFRK